MNINTAILVAILGCVGKANGAEPSQQTRELVDALDRQSWVERDQSTIELIGADQAISLSDLEYFLNDQTLTLEQRHRLIRAIEARFLGLPKGGLGVAVRRNNQLIDLDLPLGSYRDLARAGFLDPIITKRALELRCKRRGITLPVPDPRIPSRRVPTAITGGHAERVQIGQTTRSQPGPAWTSPMVIEERIAIIQMKRDGIERELLDAKLKLLEELIEQTRAEIDASNDPALIEWLDAKLEGLSKQIESSTAKLDALSDIPRRIPSQPSP